MGEKKLDKNFSKIVLLTVTALGLVGCSRPQKSTQANSSVKKNSGSAVVVKKAGHLKSDNLTPQQTVSTIVAYAGKKYPSEWGTALRNAESNGLKVILKNQSNYSYMNNGSGVAYMITNDLGYTLKQVGTTNQIYLFADNKELTNVSISQMVDYLNHHDGEKVVKNLVGSAQIDDKRNEDTDTRSSNNDNSTNKKSNIQGDAGLITVPSELQGTWYGYVEDQDKMDVVKFDEHSISDNNRSNELHKVDVDFINHHQLYQMSKSYQKATQDWGMASIFSKPVHSITWLNIRGWMQEAGDGEYYGVTKENGQQVMVSAHGAGIWADTVYWKTPVLAKQYKDKKFDNLDYGE